MHCATCNRDSTNRRVCPHCFTPYPPPDDGAPSLRRADPTPVATRTVQQSAGEAALGARNLAMRQTPLVRWTALGIAAVLAFWFFSGGTDAGKAQDMARSVPVPVVTGPPMTSEQAEALIRQTRTVALVETSADEVFVSYSAATFPLKPEGQLALVQRFMQADEVVEQRKRRIFFYNPNGRLFAQSDGVTGVRLK